LKRGGGGCGDIPLLGGIGWNGEEGGEKFSHGVELDGDGGLLAGVFFESLVVIALFVALADVDTIVELVAGELEFLAVVVVLEEADEMAGGEVRIVDCFEGALGGEVAGLVEEAGGLLAGGRTRGRGRVLVAAPLEDVGAVEAPDGHAGGFDAVGRAEFGAILPAVAGAWGRVVEEEEEFVEEGDGLAVGILGALEAVMQGVEPGDFWR
jgi:hypothetical protein